MTSSPPSTLFALLIARFTTLMTRVPRYIAGLREAAAQDAPKDGDFEAFATYVLNLLATNAVKCNKGDSLPKHISNLLSFTITGQDWHKIIGTYSIV